MTKSKPKAKKLNKSKAKSSELTLAEMSDFLKQKKLSDNKPKYPSYWIE